MTHCECGGYIAWQEYPDGHREGSCYGACGAYHATRGFAELAGCDQQFSSTHAPIEPSLEKEGGMRSTLNSWTHKYHRRSPYYVTNGTLRSASDQGLCP